MIKILPELEFQESRRELLLDRSIYVEIVESLAIRIPQASKNLLDNAFLAEKDSAALMRMTRARAKNSVKLLAVSYSAGAPVSELRAWFPSVLEHFEEYAVKDKAFDDEAGPGGAWVAHVALQGTDFSVANQVICMGILLGWGHLLERFAAIIDYRNSRMDGMLERLLASFVPGRPAAPDECTKHLPYFKTLKIFRAEPSKRPAMMKQYLAEWYVASRREPYYDSHTRDTSFVGYWSWEAAAITFLLDIDDSSYADAMFYPKDLVDFARQASRDYFPPEFPAPKECELRAKAGDRCPRAGEWESLTIPPQIRTYAEGSLIEDIPSPYGLAVWKLA